MSFCIHVGVLLWNQTTVGFLQPGMPDGTFPKSVRRIYFTHQSGKGPAESIWKGEALWEGALDESSDSHIQSGPDSFIYCQSWVRWRRLEASYWSVMTIDAHHCPVVCCHASLCLIKLVPKLFVSKAKISPPRSFFVKMCQPVLVKLQHLCYTL